MGTPMDDLLNNAPCGFVTFADDGALLAVNATLLDMLGQDLADVQGRHLQTILSVGTRVFYQTHFFPLLKMQGKIEEIYLSLRAKDGTEVPVLVNAVRREQEGEIVNDCIFVAMHQRNRYEDAILQARKVAEEATRAKDGAYAELAQANGDLELANVELEAQKEELRRQQMQLLELNARLHARAEREALLNRIGQAIRLHKSKNEILETAVASLAKALKIDRCYFVEYNIARDWARVTTDWRRSDLPSLSGTYRISDFDLDIAETYGSAGLSLSRDTQTINATFSPKTAAALIALGVRSEIGVALFEGGVPVASVNVAMADAPRVWTEEEVRLVQAVATLIQTTIQEARLHAREHNIAEQLQEALQPQLPDDLPGLELDAYYRPALDEAGVGGDFYDGFALGPGCYALAVADLSGKGLHAASEVATVRHMLRAALYQPGTTMAEAITSLSHMLTEHALLSGFATLFVGAFDANQRTFTYVNAGQEPGLIYREAGPAVEQMEATGPILGGFPGAMFQERTISLAPGDVIALFTDGLTEAGVDRKDLLGISGVARIFEESVGDEILLRPATPQAITAGMMQGIETKVSMRGIRDDVCLLVACIK